MTPFAYIVSLPVRAYRMILSPWVGMSCRYRPTCSAYSL
ncbi:MAG: putative component of membrane protein insertase Oxa1/YidC/SpoIIIJ protein YidD, partial [Yoonia sp.]